MFDDVFWKHHPGHDDESSYDGDYGRYAGSPRSATPRCKFWGSKDVYWVHSGVRWRLYNSAATEIHVCPPKDNNPEGFE